jgi:hypothetical protein
MYNLAAHRFHDTIATESREYFGTLYAELALRAQWPELGEPLELAKPVEDRTLKESDREAKNLVEVAAATRLDAVWSLRSLRSQRTRDLSEFLETTIEPSAAVLLAGIRLENGSKYDSREDPIHSPKELLHRLRGERASKSNSSGQLVGPRALVAYAEHSPHRSYRVDYNLACFYASLSDRASDAWSFVHTKKAFQRFPGRRVQWPDDAPAQMVLDILGTERDEAAQLGLAALDRSLRRADTEDRAALIRWAQKDPTLKGLRERGLEEILRRWGVAAEHPELHQPEASSSQ